MGTFEVAERYKPGQTILGDDAPELVLTCDPAPRGRWTVQTVPIEGQRRIGYARVSGIDQTHALQLDALGKIDLDALVVESASGVKARPALATALSCLRAGDELHVWRRDRLGRHAIETVQTLCRICELGAVVVSVTEGTTDPSTPVGMIQLAITASFAQQERETMLERSRAGIEAARARGTHLGRPPSLTVAQKVEITSRVGAGEWTCGSAAKLFGVSLRTVRRVMAGAREQE